jgi:hypothetical protein
LLKPHQGAVHVQITTIGLDIAKNVFQVDAGIATNADEKGTFLRVAGDR